MALATTMPERVALSFAWIATWRASSARFDEFETLTVISSRAAAVSSSEAACCSVRRERSSAPLPISRVPLWQVAWESGLVYGTSMATWQVEEDDQYLQLVNHEAAILFTEDDLLFVKTVAPMFLVLLHPDGSGTVSKITGARGTTPRSAALPARVEATPPIAERTADGAPTPPADAEGADASVP